jgi:hypothetical protein
MACRLMAGNGDSACELVKYNCAEHVQGLSKRCGIHLHQYALQLRFGNGAATFTGVQAGPEIDSHGEVLILELIE